MTNPAEITARARAVVAREMGLGEDTITRDVSFRDDLGADDLDCIELTMALEEAFDIEISDDEAERLRTFGQTVDWMVEKLCALVVA